ncbi:nucleotidyltransferase domain-containing protein [Candidatus Izemoplasma sp. B36]|uniref:nucleotidyltransferase domain-containing protein n=1 Tax=Candidatus Izemoplasma sp. B36 TaxID=3242468 RepID=UPI003557CE10
MIKIIDQYINKMKEKHQIIGAMIVGSYIQNKMKEHSDIDIFFLSKVSDKSIRGREVYKGLEFEYFISPYHSFIKRIESSITSASIYSKAKIILDEQSQLKNIQEKAVKEVKDYKVVFSFQQRIDYKFKLETILYDVIDMDIDSQKMDLMLYMNTNIESLLNLICKIKSKPPVYLKYGMSEIKKIDLLMYKHLKAYFESDNIVDKKENYLDMIRYLLSYFIDVDVKEYYQEKRI